MSKVLAQHWPHFGFLVIGVVAFLWFALRPESDGDRGRLAEEPAPRPVPAPSSVRPSAARRGMLALGPLLATVATGAILYGVDIAGDSPPGAVIWVHSGISALALLLVVYKVSDLGLARIRRAFSRQNLHELVSIVLGALSVPITITGIALLFAPSTGSTMAYLHLISSAWWTGLLVWHLRRYLGASLRVVFRTATRQTVSPPGRARAARTAPAAVRAASGPRSDPRPSRPA
jgi:hypothetical protein